MKKTTRQHYADYVREVKRLMAKGGFGDWSVQFELFDYGEGKELRTASCNSDPSKRWVTFFWNSTQNDDYTDGIRSAKHEVGHLIMSTLRMLGDARFVQEDAMDLEEERICRILEKLL